MNKYFLGLFVIVSSGLGITSCSSSKSTAAKTVAVTDSVKVDSIKIAVDSFAYGLGMNIGNNLKDQGVEKLDYAALVKGMADIFDNKKTAITEQEANASIQQTMQGYMTKKADAEKARAKAFLDSNAKRPGVVTLPSGLQYEVIKKGDSTSVMPKAEDTIVANYVGMLIDGKEFDNSIKRGQPLTIKANEVIRGWTEIVQRMHIGDKWTVFIPSELGYGERGAGQDIPPGAALVFELELLGVKPFVAGMPPIKTDKVVAPVVAPKAKEATTPKSKSKTKATIKPTN